MHIDFTKIFSCRSKISINASLITVIKFLQTSKFDCGNYEYHFKSQGDMFIAKANPKTMVMHNSFIPDIICRIDNNDIAKTSDIHFCFLLKKQVMYLAGIIGLISILLESAILIQTIYKGEWSFAVLIPLFILIGMFLFLKIGLIISSHLVKKQIVGVLNEMSVNNKS